jgi:enterochelin esterase family protein
MAQFVRLATSIEEGRNIMLPDIVAARYAKQSAPPDAQAATQGDSARRMDAGSIFPLRMQLPKGTRAYVSVNGQARELSLDKEGQTAFDIPVAAGETHVAVAINAPNGASSFQRLRLYGLTAEESQQEQRAEQTPEFIEMMKRAQASPLVEGERATFVYRGKAKRVEMVGDSTGWGPRGLFMREVAGTEIKYITYTFPRAARVEYKFIADGEWMLDPLNPNKLDNGVGGENSVLTMPDYRASAYINEPGGVTVPPFDPQKFGSWKLSKFVTDDAPSGLLKGSRKITVYLPPAYEKSSEQRFPVLYVQDGSDYLRRAQAAIIADKLIEEKKVAPFIIVFVDPANRMSEYWANDQFADFMATELVPFIDTRYRTRADRQSRALLGASLGGVISVWTGLRHPDVFARIGGQSSAFQIDQERVVSALARLDAPRPAQPLKFYFDVGRLEPLLRVNRRVHALLAAKGYTVAYHEAEAGHNYTSWRDQLADAYIALWKE